MSSKRKIVTSKSSKKKQKFDVIDLKPDIDSDWIAASKTRNYILNDPLLDWLDLYGESKGFLPDSKTETGIQQRLNFSRYIMNQGIKFEEYTVKLLKDKFNSDFVTIDKKDKHQQISETYTLMTLGTKIIYQGLIFNPKTKTFGYPDLIVRSDYLNELTNEVISEDDVREGCRFSSRWHYRVVDIKFTSLKFKANKRTLLNQGNVKAYKAQVFVYNQALAYLQSYNPNTSYLFGRDSILAEVDFEEDDFEVVDDVLSSLEWLKDVRIDGENWNILPPSRSELYPNMCNSSSNWQKTKSFLSKELSEVTAVWQCGVKNREIAHENKVFKWTDERCNSENLGIGGKINPPLVDKILNINRGEKIYDVDKDVLRKFNLPKDGYFIDFETVSNINNIISTEGEFIFMIGVLDKDNNTKTFTIDRLDLKSEREMILKFLDYIKLDCSFYHYSFAEPSHFKKALERHKIKPRFNIKWIDLLKVVKESNFIVKGMLNFSLKSVVSALSSHKMINIDYTDSDVCNGSQAMIAAFLADEEAKEKNISLSDIEVIKCVEKYNEIDCLTLKSLLDVLHGLI